MKVWLVGYMGSGKSSIGRRAAALAGYGFADTDKEVERIAGMSIAEIFGQQGEARFRELEKEVLENAAAGAGDIIIATGGGMPCFGDNMEYMNRTGLTVYLRSGTDRLLRRLGPGRDRRPLLRGMDDDALRAYIDNNMEVRETFYMSAAAVIECDGACDDYVVRQILNIVRQYPGETKHKLENVTPI